MANERMAEQDRTRKKRMEESTKKTNLIEKKKAKFKALQESARGEGSAQTSPMRTERAFEKFRSPRNAKTYFADRPGSKYEGMAKENLEKQIEVIRDPSFKVMKAKGGRVNYGSGGKACAQIKGFGKARRPNKR
tara:strand:+ start:84 stop:485 length:402 start_codon:yes stop_codon:yes gene_type:complete